MKMFEGKTNECRAKMIVISNYILFIRGKTRDIKYVFFIFWKMVIKEKQRSLTNIKVAVFTRDIEPSKKMILNKYVSVGWLMFLFLHIFRIWKKIYVGNKNKAVVWCKFLM